MDGGEKCFVAGVIAVVILVGGAMISNYMRDVNVVEAIKAGADPITAACAIDGIKTSNQLICQGKPQ